MSQENECKQLREIQAKLHKLRLKKTKTPQDYLMIEDLTLKESALYDVVWETISDMEHL